MTLLLFPFHTELQGFFGGMEGTREKVISGFKTFTTESHSTWTLAVCGQGKVEVALAVSMLGQTLHPRRLFLVGSATALDSKLATGDIVVGWECLEIDCRSGGEGKPPRHSGTLDGPALQSKGMVQGRILSADADLFEPAEKKRLGEKYQAQAYAWEGAGFYRALKKLGLKGLELRVITETVSESRLELTELKSRIQAHFPRLRREMETWEANLSNIG